MEFIYEGLSGHSPNELLCFMGFFLLYYIVKHTIKLNGGEIRTETVQMNLLRFRKLGCGLR